MRRGNFSLPEKERMMGGKKLLPISLYPYFRNKQNLSKNSQPISGNILCFNCCYIVFCGFKYSQEVHNISDSVRELRIEKGY